MFAESQTAPPISAEQPRCFYDVLVRTFAVIAKLDSC